MAYKHGDYWLFHNQSIESDSYKHHIKMAWFVVRYSQDKYKPQENNKMYVELGDIIKFGRVRFRIRKLCLNYEDESVDGNSEIRDFQDYLQRNF